VEREKPIKFMIDPPEFRARIAFASDENGRDLAFALPAGVLVRDPESRA
jgi:hypothetical protein